MSTKINDIEKVHGFYYDLDSLFDTRLATLEKINKEVAEKLLGSTLYYTRDRDDFEGVNYLDFREAYKKRDRVTLANSKPTNVLFSMLDTIMVYIDNTSREGLYNKNKIIINIYPYKFTANEINEIVTCIKVKTKYMMPVTVINTNPYNVDVSYVDNNISYMYMYDWDGWLRNNYLDLAKKRLDDVVLIAPKIWPLSKQEGKEQVDKITKDIIYNDDIEVKDLFKEVQDLAKIFIGLEFMEAREFCIFTPDDMRFPVNDNTDKHLYQKYNYISEDLNLDEV